MIAELEGTVRQQSGRTVVLATGGVGWLIFVSSETKKSLPKPGSPLKLFTYLAVRENALELFGFASERERSFFELLIEIPGVGPKSALAILGLAPPETLERAVAAGDASYLTKIAGIGRKTAEKIILELGDKIATIKTDGSDLQEESETLEALRSLGYNLAEARAALKNLPAESVTTSQKVKAALQRLGQPKK